MQDTWTEYDVYEFLPDGSIEPYTSTFMTYEDARLEYDCLVQQHPNKRFVLVQGDFKVVKRSNQ